MNIGNTLRVAAFLGASLLATTGAKAVQVDFITTGVFTGGDLAGSNTYLDAASGVSIVFTDSLNNSVNTPPTSQVSFGTFNTSGTISPGFSGILGGFTLTITQITPTIGALEFTSTLTGTIRVDNSQAYILFDGPLTQSIDSIFYQIASADDSTPGRHNLSAPGTNGGMSSLTGRVGVNPVPEPASVVMMGLGCVSLLAVGYRKRNVIA